MRTTITIDGPGLMALARTLRSLADDVDRAHHYMPARIDLTVREHTIAGYGRPSTAIVRIEETRA